MGGLLKRSKNTKPEKLDFSNRLSNISIAARLGLIVAVLTIGVCAIGISKLAEVRPKEIAAHQEMIRNLADSAQTVAQTYYGQQLQGKLTQSQAQAATLAVLQGMRYDSDNYFWVNDMHPNMVMHPYDPGLNGKDLSNYADPNGKLLFKEFVNTVQTKGSGFVYYSWPKPGSDKPVPKLSYVTSFKPWGWIIGTGVYIDDINALVRHEWIAWSIQLALVLLITIIVAVAVSKSITNPIKKLTRAMKRSKTDSQRQLLLKDQPVEIANLAQSVRDAHKAEMAREHAHNQFFSIASHELRTPLTAIRGNTAMMQEYYGQQLADPTLKDMVKDIHDSSVRLIGIVNDFLDMSRLELSKVEFNISEFDVIPLIDSVVQMYGQGHLNSSLYLNFAKPRQAPPLVLADQDRLKQVLINLVSNALKYTEKGGATISVVQESNKIFIDVSDTGKGIPKDMQDRLFHKFTPASQDALTRDASRSTGLGLYISKMIMEQMHGDLELLESHEGKGSTFRIIVPVSTHSK